MTESKVSLLFQRDFFCQTRLDLMNPGVLDCTPLGGVPGTSTQHPLHPRLRQSTFVLGWFHQYSL